MAKKETVKKEVSPAGLAYYPYLNQSDTKFNANGVYHVKLTMDIDDPKVAAFIEKIDGWHKKAMDDEVAAMLDSGKVKTEAAARKKLKAGDIPYAFIEDDDGEDTNLVRVHFKRSHRVPNKKKPGEFYVFSITAFDAARNVLENPPSVYSGSELKVRFEPNLWCNAKKECGVQLRMDAYQIIKLVTGGGATEDPDGFEEEEGYEGDESTHQAPATTAQEAEAPAADVDGGDDGDF